jgi:hypothetical protein
MEKLIYRHFNNYILLRKSTAKRVRKRLPRLLKRYEKNEITQDQFRSSLGSTIGWIKWANTFHLKSCLRLDNMLQLAQAA